MAKTDGAKGGGGRPPEKHQLEIRGSQEPPAMPDGIGEHAAKLWALAIESLPHVLRPVDFSVLRLCCEAFQAAKENSGRVDDEKHKRFISAITEFGALAKQIGLTPHSRRVIKPVPEAKEDTDTAFEDWLRRGGLN